MAKQVAAEQAKSTAMTELEDALAAEFAGAGISNKAADNIVPQIKILQPLSPEVVEGKTVNAKPGDFLMGTELIPAATGFYFQPCHQDQCWLEFLPLAAGGGFVAKYDWLGENGSRPIAPQGAKMLDDYHFKMGDNELLHYRQWAGLVWKDGRPLERVLNFKSTGHTVARNWMSRAREANRLPNGFSRSLFSHVYQLTTERQTNAKGTWYQLNVGTPILIASTNPDCIPIVGSDPIAVLRLGRQLYDAFESQQLTAEIDAAQPAAPQSATHGDEIPF